jgi:hypothetical protein
MDPPAPRRFCRVGRRTAEGRIGNTVEAFDETTRQQRPALGVAPRAAARYVAALARCPASRSARLLADRNAAAQRRLGLPDNIML